MKYTEVNPFTGKNIDEDAPANATGPSVAGTGDDSSVVVVRKKKKKDTLYDGRTKIARKFIERILKQRESRRLTKEEVEVDEGTRKSPNKKEYNELLKKMKRPIKAKDAVKMIKKYIVDDELQDDLEAIASRRPNEDVVPIIKKRLKSGDIDLPEEVELDEGKKVYKVKQNIGKSKFVVDFHDGKKKHRDGSDFFDMKIFNNKKDLEKFEKELKSKGFVKEEVELDEVLKPKDKKVIDDFVQANKGTGAQNFTQRGNIVDYEGRSLEKSGMGAQQIASIESDPKDSHKIKIRAKMDSRSTQSIVNYLKKSAKKYNIKVEETVKGETMEITEEVMTLKTKDNVMGLKVFNSAKGLGLKAALVGKFVRVKGSKKQINDFGRTVIGKSSMGSPTELNPPQVDKIPREDKMLNKRLKEEKLRNFTNFVLETTNDFGVEYLLVENNIKILQNIVKKKQNAKIKFKDNKRATVDLFTASAIMKVYDAVKPDNKKKMEKLINGTLPEFLKIQAFAMKQVKMK